MKKPLSLSSMLALSPTLVILSFQIINDSVAGAVFYSDGQMKNNFWKNLMRENW